MKDKVYWSDLSEVKRSLAFLRSLLKAARLSPPVRPSSGASRLVGAAVIQCVGGAWARCVCPALVKEGQLLSAAKEGTKKLHNAFAAGHGSSPVCLLILCPSHSETNMAWEESWRKTAKLSGVTRRGGLSCRCLEVFCCFPVVGPRRWRRLSPRSGVPVCPAPCKT